MVSSLCGLQHEGEGEGEGDEDGEEEKLFQKLPSDVQKDVLQKCAGMYGLLEFNHTDHTVIEGHVISVVILLQKL